MRTQSCPLLAVLDHREPRWHSLRDVHGDVRAAHARCAGAMRNVHRDRNGLPRIPSQDALRHPSAATHRAGFPCAAAQHRSPGGPISPELKPDISRGGYVRRSGIAESWLKLRLDGPLYIPGGAPQGSGFAASRSRPSSSGTSCPCGWRCGSLSVRFGQMLQPGYASQLSFKVSQRCDYDPHVPQGISDHWV